MPSPAFEAAWTEKVSQVQRLLSELADLSFNEFGFKPPHAPEDVALTLRLQINAVDAEGNDMVDPVPVLLVRAATMESRYIHKVLGEDGSVIQLKPGPSVFGCIGISE